MSSPSRGELPLLEALLALKPNVIYTMGGRQEISAAALAYSHGAVAGFRWGESGRLLEARMASPGKPSVLFTCEDGRLQTAMNPPSMASKRLVLAAVMTIARVLAGSKFHQVDLSPEVVEKLRRQLKAPMPDAVRPRVILTEGAAGRPFELDYDSGTRAASWRVVGPDPGMEWLVWQAREPGRVGEAFCRWLGQDAGSTVVVVRLREGAVRVENAKAAVYSGRTEFAVQENQVMIRRAVRNEAGELVESFVDLGYGLVFLRDQSIFARIQPEDGWREFSRLSVGGKRGSRLLVTPTASFHVPHPEGSGNGWALLDRNGSAVEAVSPACRGRLEVTTEGARVRLAVRVATDDGRLVPVHRTLATDFGDLFWDGPFALLVKSPARRRRLGERLLAILQTTADSAGDWADIADDPAFTNRHMHGDDAVRCLRFLWGRFQELDRRFLVVGDPAEKNPWRICVGSGQLLARALAVCVNGVPGLDVLRNEELSWELDARQGFEVLPAVIRAAESAGVDVWVDGKPPRLENLALRIRLVPDGELDWFELHPEVCAGTLTIPRSRWEEVLRTGIFHSADCGVVVLEGDSFAVLRQMAGMVTSEGPVRLSRLRIFDWLFLRRNGVPCDMPSELAGVLDALQHFETIPRQPLPSGLRAELREYQQHGYDWLCFLYRHRFGGCLADDMGLGKTLQTITLLAALQDGTLARQDKEGRPHLLVLPPTLLFNWQSEIQKFAPGLKVYEYVGGGRSVDFAGADVVMTTYDLVRRDIEVLEGLAFDVAIFDEAQAVKNAAAARTQALMRIQARFRLCLTGTPLENHIGEFHSIMETAVPGLFGSRAEFQRAHEAGAPVLERARPFLLRRTKKNILSELPPKIESDDYFSLSNTQRECYTRAVEEVRREVLAAFEDRPAQQAGIMALAALLRLRQICISPAMLSDQFAVDSPKIDFLVEQLTELAAEGHAALVFSQFVKALDLAAAALEGAGIPFVRMDGKTPVAQRKALVARFQSGEGPGVFLISLKTGGAGLNLTRASYVYHLDPWWNPAVENQASDRVHRIGQKQSVFIQRLVMRHTVEEKMMALKQGKQALFARVVESGAAPASDGAASLTAADFQFLIGS